MSFPNQVQTNQAPAVEGDWVSANPHFSYDAGEQGLVAGAGLYVGRAAWVDIGLTDLVANSSGSGSIAGIVPRVGQAGITQFLGETSMQIVPGRQVGLLTGGDIWLRNNGSLITTVGMKAYANYATGLFAFAASGAPPNAAVVTGSIAAQATTSVTASFAPQQLSNPGLITTGQMTVTAVGSGAIVIGGTVSGTGVQAGTIVTGQVSGTTGGIGVYTVNIAQTVASTTVTQASGLLTVTAVASGVLGVGDVLSGVNVTGAPIITAPGTGTGGTGTYVVSVSETAASATINATGYVETKWICFDQGRAVGELVRCSDHPAG